VKRFTANYPELASEMIYLHPGDLVEFELKAQALSFDEVLTFLGLDLEEIPASDLFYAKKAHARGKVSAIHKASECLFSNMNTRNGAQSALAYLVQTSGTFSVDATPVGKTGGFSFNVNINDD
jgi:hypothetical protein